MLEIVILPHFQKQLKQYKKKFSGLKEALLSELNSFKKERAIGLGRDLYKIRLSIKGLQKGKSGSFRVILFIAEVEQYLIPITLYFKGDTENLTKKDLEKHLATILQELS